MSTLEGMRDAHIHLHAHGAELSHAQLAGCDSREACLERIARAAQGKGPDDWVQGVGARAQAWRVPEWPTAHELHETAGGRPCVVRSFDHHALVASARALELAGVGAETTAPPGGVIERGPGGVPTGLLLEKACELVWRVLPAPSPQERKGQVRTALRDLASRGFVEAHDMLAEPWLGACVSELWREGDAGARAVKVWLYASPERLREMREASRGWESCAVRLAGGKLFLDGTINSRTAWMLEPFEDAMPGHPRGTPLLAQGEIESAVAACDAMGLGIAMHAIGDAAVRAALDALERVRPSMLGAVDAGEPWRAARIEHCEFVHEADAPRFAALGAVCSVQPCHLLADVEALRRFTLRSLPRLWPLRETADAVRASGRRVESLVWMGSDTPIVPPRVEDNVQAAVRRSRAGDALAFTPEQALTREEVLACSRAADGPRATVA